MFWCVVWLDQKWITFLKTWLFFIKLLGIFVFFFLHGIVFNRTIEPNSRSGFFLRFVVNPAGPHFKFMKLDLDLWKLRNISEMFWCVFWLDQKWLKFMKTWLFFFQNVGNVGTFFYMELFEKLRLFWKLFFNLLKSI